MLKHASAIRIGKFAFLFKAYWMEVEKRKINALVRGRNSFFFLFLRGTELEILVGGPSEPKFVSRSSNLRCLPEKTLKQV